MLLRRVRPASLFSSCSRPFSILPEHSSSDGNHHHSMQDEYSDKTSHPSAISGVYEFPDTLYLENGGTLVRPHVAYTTYGTLNASRDNVLVLCHALTGHSLVHQYYHALVTPEWTSKYFIVCSNILGSCYGTTGPGSLNPVTGHNYGPDFPRVTIRDAVALQRRFVQDRLGVRQVAAVIGGSLGGMQTLEWAFQGHEFVQRFVAIACGAQHTAWQIGLSELQRQAVYMDPNFCHGRYTATAPPTAGLALARQIAMVSYRAYGAYNAKFGRATDSKDGRFRVQSYLQYQGEKFLARFDVNAYLTLLHMMDTHDVGRGRGGTHAALETLRQPALVIGIDSDVLYPVCEQEQVAASVPNAQCIVLSSPHGHDGFLLEQATISDLIHDFLHQP